METKNWVYKVQVIMFDLVQQVYDKYLNKKTFCQQRRDGR